MSTKNPDLAPLERYADLVDDFSVFKAVCQQPLPTVVRVNSLKASRDQVIEAYAEAGVPVEPIEWDADLLRIEVDNPGKTWPYIHGLVHTQGAASALAVPALAPAPGETVLDLCAAPGSKTSQIAGHQEDRGTVVANDVNLGRIAALRSNCDRLGVTSVAVTNRDGRQLSSAHVGCEYGFDRVLVDAPCSCEGTVRKNPDTFEDWSISAVEGIADLQEGLLVNAIDQTVPGGSVLYSTCTFAPEENEAVIDAVLDRRECHLDALDLRIESTPGVTEWEGTTYASDLRRSVRVWPHHNDTGGFFLAKLRVPQ